MVRHLKDMIYTRTMMRIKQKPLNLQQSPAVTGESFERRERERERVLQKCAGSGRKCKVQRWEDKLAARCVTRHQIGRNRSSRVRGRHGKLHSRRINKPKSIHYQHPARKIYMLGGVGVGWGGKEPNRCDFKGCLCLDKVALV